MIAVCDLARAVLVSARNALRRGAKRRNRRYETALAEVRPITRLAYQFYRIVMR